MADAPNWSPFDAVLYRFIPNVLGGAFGGTWGGRPRLEAYKSAWIAHNRQMIHDVAIGNALPADLIGCVAYNEVGGDPPAVKHYMVLPLRQQMEQLPRWAQFTKPSLDTSEGPIKIQLRNAAELLGIDPRTLTRDQEAQLTRLLETDLFNLKIVALFLHKMILFDYPQADTAHLTDEQFIIAGCRYNRGTGRSLADFLQSLKEAPGSPGREYTSYGRAMMAHRAHVRQLLGDLM